ncbi:MAG TPA: hypothetical protein VGZ71_16340 [Puia sp.]|jgi:hypothetical protein|nr:hypothetical protein [Puia sp.]
MDEPFIISVFYKGKKREFEARFQKWGFSHRFLVEVEGIPLFFERDEEGSYRAVLFPETAREKNQVIDAGLLKAIAGEIQSILS